MASPIQPLLTGSRKADGSPNAGGLVVLSRYDAANVRVTGFTSRDATAAHVLDNGGYRLDAAGRAAIFIEEACRVRTYDSANVAVDSFVWEPTVNAGLVEVLNPGFTGQDPVSLAQVAGGRTVLDTVLSSLASSLGGQDGKFRGTYGTADTDLWREIEQLALTPQRFGARGDGIADDTSAMLLLAAAQGASGIPVFFPRGTYLVSSVITFGSNVVAYGTGPYSAGSTIVCSNATQNGLVFGSNCDLRGFMVRSSSGSTGIGITVAGNSLLMNVSVWLSGPGFTTGVSNTSGGQCRAIQCTILGSVTATVGAWLLDSSPSGATSATTYFTLSTPVIGQPWRALTQDVANGGAALPFSGLIGQGLVYNRIRATSAGGATVAAPSSPLYVEQLVLDCFNNSGGAFTFTLAAGYKNAGNPAPANGSRVCITFYWNATESVWVETGRATST